MTLMANTILVSDTLPGKTPVLWAVFNREEVDGVFEHPDLAADDVAKKKVMFPELEPWLVAKYTIMQV